ncbi:MAG TPA: cyclic nucleotide-binding domain-containing protein [Anaerolineae bacterium]|nr:cyclic nucleotide-binding domain-containing protein [Anaerolineae bacterium]
MASKIEFLSKHRFCRELHQDEFSAFVNICTEYTFREGSVIAYQRDVADRAIFIKEGRLFVSSVDGRGIVRNSRSYFPGDCIGQGWLFADETHPATIRAGSDGSMIMITGERFRNFLQRYPTAIQRLQFDEEGANYASKSNLVDNTRVYTQSGLMEDELVEFWSQRTPYLLLLSAAPFAILALITFGSLLAMFLHNNFGSGNWSPFIMLPTLLGGLFLLLIVIFQILDWRNDYFLITNKHIVHREFSLRTLRIRTNKIPLDQVQSVEVDKPNFLSNLLNVGTARITTAAMAGTIYFNYIDNPRLVKETINRLTHQVVSLDDARAQETMRKAIERHFNIDPAYKPVRLDQRVQEQPRQVTLWERIQNGLKSRIEEDGVVNYRKHYLILLAETWRNLLFSIFLIMLMLFSLNYNFFTTYILFGSFVTLLLLVGVLVWRFEDWRNDTFQVSDLYVIDIDRQPFGFGESRKQAQISNIQNVNADRPSFWATIFNFGNVEIEVAGADANIVFENVVNPDQVQSDIFQRRERIQKTQRSRNAGRQRQEYTLLLDVYQQVKEQEQIPRRTGDFKELFAQYRNEQNQTESGTENF